MRILLAAALTMGFAGAASAADCSALQIKNSVSMEPVQRYGLVMIPITLNGVEKKFLFDTGGAINSISRATVEELKLPELPSRFRATDLYGNASQSYVQVREVTLGRANGTAGRSFRFTATPISLRACCLTEFSSTGRFAHDDIELDFSAVGAGKFLFHRPLRWPR